MIGTAAPHQVRPSLPELAARIEALRRGRRRILVGLTGPPGVGKSTLGQALLDRLGTGAVLVPMDGFHLSNRVLRELGLSDRKGAPETFDAAGYVALLRRLRQQEPEPVYAPEFRREIEEPVAGAVAVPPTATVILTEGNYLLLDRGPWARVRDLLDATWYLQADDELRVNRLIARHVAYGRTPEAARAWVMRSDETNARLIAATAGRADLVVRLDPVT